MSIFDKIRDHFGIQDRFKVPERLETINTRLIPVKHEIRILCLHPGRTEDPIRCTLRKASLKDKPRYNALSYTWGDIVTSSSITLNGTEQAVTENLESALRHLREPKKPLQLWIDALCINQEDPTEQEAQVRKMGEIYSRAETVIVWLGPGDDVSDFVMTTAKKLAKGPHMVTPFDWYKLRRLRTSVLGRDYFKRVWVIQEFLLSRNDPLLVCGHLSITWADLTGALDELDDVHPQFNSLADSQIRELEQQVKAFQNHSDAHARLLFSARWKFLDKRDLDGETHYLPISDCLAMCSQNVASKPRDFVYGVLGLMAEDDRESITISCDEKTPATDIYRQAFARIWTTDVSIMLNGKFFAFVNCDDSPSWVPDLSIQREFDVHRAFRLVNSKRWKAPEPISLSDGRTLILMAYVIDSIQSVYPVAPDLLGFKESLPKMIALANIALETSSHPLKILCNGAIRSIFTDSEVESIVSQGLPANVRSKILSAIEQVDWNALWSRYDTSNDFAAYPHKNVVQTVWNLMVESAFQLARKRCFLTTVNGLIGIGTPAVQSGDLIVLIPGSRVPFVLRSKDGHHQIVGYARVSGVTKPQYLDKYSEQGLMPLKEFRIC